MFRADLRKILVSPLFYVCVLALTACALSSAWYVMQETEELFYLATQGWGIGNGTVGVAIPLLSGIASAGSYCEERQGGFHYSVMVRGTRLRYCVSKVSAAVLGGFLMVFAAGLLFLPACMLLKKGDFVLAGEAFRMVFERRWEMVLIEHGWPVLAWLSWLFSYCVAAAVWPALALCVSLFVRNRYVVMVSPFLAEQLWGTLVIGIHRYSLSVTSLLPSISGSGWRIRLGVAAVLCLAELAVFTLGVMRETR